MVSVVYCLSQSSATCNSYAVSCDSSVETVLLEDDILKDMGNDSGIKKLFLLVLAVVIVIALWRTLWFLAGVAIFIFVVYFVYE